MISSLASTHEIIYSNGKCSAVEKSEGCGSNPYLISDLTTEKFKMCQTKGQCPDIYDLGNCQCESNYILGFNGKCTKCPYDEKNKAYVCKDHVYDLCGS